MGSSFNDLSAVIAIGVAVSMVMRLIRQPLTIGYIITGIIVGPALLHIIDTPDSIKIFADFGIALLLLIVGLGLNPRIVKEVGKIAAYIAIGKIVGVTSLVYVLAQFFGYDRTSALYLGIALSFSSTIIILKLLTDKKEQNRLYGKISIGFLLIEDIVATAVLIGVSASASSEGLSIQTVGSLLVKIIGLIIGLVLFRNLILSRFNTMIAKSQELLFLFAIGWALGLATLFKETGFSLEVGALLAGVMLAPLPYAQEAASRLKPLRDFFIVLFFVSVGSHLHLENVAPILPEALFFSALVLFGNPIMVLIIAGLSGYTKKTSFKTSMTGGQISEFSLILILLVNEVGKVDDSLVTLVTVIGLITIAISTYLITYSDALYAIFEDSLKFFERRKARPENEKVKKYDVVLFGYMKGGHEFIKVFEQMNKSFVVVDYDPGIIDTLEHRGIHYVYGDVTDLELLEELNLEHTKLIVSTITDLGVNNGIADWLAKVNPRSVFICMADTVEEASELYTKGATYVILPHYIGSEKISAFIKRSGLKKSEFNKYREKHLAYLQSHYDLLESENNAA
ncbi:MAG: cation:proton antiporter [Candidatus Saccharibacteria bacterium]|nr:cation:proton antiporter [Candidatus Saccharibacteria bacterium]